MEQAMNRIMIMISSALVLMGGFALAQSRSPYAGFEKRSIKALSDQQIGDLRAGLGLSLALAAELNGYPGPRHTLEFAKELNLSEEQRTQVDALFEAMKAESIAIGETLIAQEAELDRQFARKTITPESLRSLTDDIGLIQGVLRATHLKYHLSTTQLLTPIQARRYDELRGYSGTENHNPAQHRP
jgi:Spy/CpxP family protein refolding chaperone